MTGAETWLGMMGGLVGLGACEALLHRRRLARLPIRLHVSGTRGKSSVTRLLAAGLCAGGLTTVAKTTGTAARLIFPDGIERAIPRPTGPSLIEQTHVVKAAVRAGASALVVECMALQPRHHWVSERSLIRATHAVITNIRADHLDVMGPTEADVARAIASMIPVRGTLYTAEESHLAILRAAAADRATRLVVVDAEDIACVTNAELAGFAYVEHAANVALALRVLADFGLTRERALAGMRAAAPDPGSLADYDVAYFDRRFVFVNGFAANDPASSLLVWREARARHPEPDRVVAVYNLRADRAARTAQLAEEARVWRTCDDLLLIGSGAPLFARLVVARGCPAERVHIAESDSPLDLFERLLDLAARPTLFVGLGNIGGAGLDLVQTIAHRARSVPHE